MIDVSQKQSAVCEIFKLLFGQGTKHLKDIFKVREITRTLRSNIGTQLV